MYERFWFFNTTSLNVKRNLALHEHFLKPTKQSKPDISFSKMVFKLDVATKTIRLSDLDIVKKSYDVKYLEWCLVL
jgi:hypothetical protein